MIAEDFLVRRVVHTGGRQQKGAPETAQDSMLAFHIVGAGRDVAHRRAAQHHRRTVQLDEIVEIAEAAGKLTRRIGLGIKAESMFAKMRRQSCPVLIGLRIGGNKFRFGGAARSRRSINAQHAVFLFRPGQRLGIRRLPVNAPGATSWPRI